MKKIFLILTIVFVSQSVLSQSRDSKWIFTVSLASAKYSSPDGKVVGGQLAYQSPRLTLSKYMFKGVTFEAGFATAIGDTQKYTTFDGFARYDFGTSENNVVPYIVIGGSFIKAKALTPTVNFGLGNTFWFSERYGLNMQALYKFSESKFQSQKSHIYTSIGLVYSFGLRSLNPRLWNEEH